MMRKLLGNAPIKSLKICTRDHVWRIRRRRLELRFELNVEGGILFRAQIRQRRGTLGGERFSEWLERFERHDPWRNARREILCQKWAERLVLPSLNVPGAPVIHQHQSENMIRGTINRYRYALRIAWSNDKRRSPFIFDALIWTV